MYLCMYIHNLRISRVDQGRKKMLLDGGADHVGGPTYVGGSGGMLPQEILLICML